ncbi:MAG: molybdenum cofactor biosynthesis protein MoaE [Candidatus Bathyarchaeota archaeon]|nr:MAG: molybdenum cofactor biosynthesis protein MoaE [Candidatus Bathyarchaeota archaeon]
MIGKGGVHSKGTISLKEIINSAKQGASFDKAGAVAIFLGVVRGVTQNKERVTKLELEAYEEKANEALEQICSALKARRGIIDVQIHHLIGDFEVGEDLVYVLVAGEHRSNVFPVLQEAVDRYKEKAPIFKKEYTAEEGKTESYWVTERKKHD